MGRGAIVLAGGANRRMGTEKWLLPVGGEPVLRRILRVIEDRVDELYVVLPFQADERMKALAAEAARGIQVHWLQDEDPDGGPLAGIAAGMTAGSCELNLVLAADMPFISGEAADVLFHACEEADSDAAMVVKDGRTHPLFAVYRRSVLDALVTYRRGEGRKVMEWVGRLRATAVGLDVWSAVDPHGYVLFNMNGPEDYEHAQRIAASQRQEY